MTRPGPKNRIQTDRLLLRRFRAGDGAALHAYLAHPQVVRFEPYGPLPRAKCDQEAARRAKDEAFWAVCLRGMDWPVGHVTISREDQDTWALGYVFSQDVWGHGYATEAATAILNRTFAAGAHRVYAMCDPENEASWRVLERLGMRREAHFRKNVYFRADPAPQWKDTYVYAILAEEWRKESCSP